MVKRFGFRLALYRLCLMCHHGESWWKDVLFRHRFPSHASSYTGFRVGAGVGGTTVAQLAHILLIYTHVYVYISHLKYVGCFTHVLIVSHNLYLNGNLYIVI